MRVPSSHSSRPQQFQKTQGSDSNGADSKVLGLRRKEYVSDIFNARAQEEEGKGGVQISHGSKALAKDFNTRVHEFLQEFPDLDEALNKSIQLVDPYNDTQGVHKAHLQVRKFRLYLRELAAAEEGHPYPSIQVLGLDDSMSQLEETHQEVRSQLAQEKDRHSPHYYYKVLPQTYSFS